MRSGPLHKSCQLSPWGQLTQVSVVAHVPLDLFCQRYEMFPKSPMTEAFYLNN